MSNVLDAIPPEHRAVIEEELSRRNPDLLEALRSTQEPSNEQSRAVVDELIHALSANYGPGHIPNQYGKAVDNAIGAYFLAWPMYD
ncbi:hypothetical protein ACX9NE_28175 [Mycobacterium sp. ML4]